MVHGVREAAGLYEFLDLEVAPQQLCQTHAEDLMIVGDQDRTPEFADGPFPHSFTSSTPLPPATIAPCWAAANRHAGACPTILLLAAATDSARLFSHMAVWPFELG